MASILPNNREAVKVGNPTNPEKGLKVHEDVGGYVTGAAQGANFNMHASDRAVFEKYGIAEKPLTIANAIPNQVGTVAAAFSFTPASNWLTGGAQPLKYEPLLSNGSALPAWLSFNAVTCTFTKAAGAGSATTITIDLKVTTPGNQSVTDQFTLQLT